MSALNFYKENHQRKNKHNTPVESKETPSAGASYKENLDIL